MSVRLLAVVVALTVWGLGDRPAPAAQKPAAGPVFKVGFAERDITPDVGMEKPGGYGKVFHKDRHDPCKARAVVFDDGKTRTAIVGLDAPIICQPTTDAVRKGVLEKCGIAPQAVMIGASHTHSGGPSGIIMPGEYDHASEFVKKLAYEKSPCADAKYLARLEAAIIEAVVEANEKRTDAKASVGSGREETVTFNRRFRMKDGVSYTHPGLNNPEIIEPAGPIDPQVGVIGVWNAKGMLMGCVVNFACHGTTSPGGTSADYIYYIEKTIRGLMGEQAIVVFVNGMSGDVTQVDNRAKHATYPRSGEVSSRLVGGKVGAESLKVLLATQFRAGVLAPVNCESRVLSIRRRVPSAGNVAKAMERVKREPAKGEDPTEWIFAKETVLLDAKLAKEPMARVEVQAVAVGPAVFFGAPAECFCQFGLDLKAGSKFPFTFPVSLANGFVGYVPTEGALGPGGGGYETRLTSFSNLEPRAGHRMVEALLQMSGAMTPGAVPQGPPPPPFVPRPGGFGKVPPQLN